MQMEHDLKEPPVGESVPLLGSVGGRQSAHCVGETNLPQGTLYQTVESLNQATSPPGSVVGRSQDQQLVKLCDMTVPVGAQGLSTRARLPYGAPRVDPVRSGSHTSPTVPELSGYTQLDDLDEPSPVTSARGCSAVDGIGIDSDLSCSGASGVPIHGLSSNQAHKGGVRGAARVVTPKDRRDYSRRNSTRRAKIKGGETAYVGSDDPNPPGFSPRAMVSHTSSSDTAPTTSGTSSPSIRSARPLSVAVGGYCRGPGGNWYKLTDGHWVTNAGLILSADTIAPGVLISGYAQRLVGYYEPSETGEQYLASSPLSLVSIPYDLPTRGIFNEAVKSALTVFRTGRNDVTVARTGFFGVLRQDYLFMKDIDTHLLNRGSLCLSSPDIVKSLTQTALRTFTTVPPEIVLESVLVHCFLNMTERNPTLNPGNLFMELQRLGPNRGPPLRDLSGNGGGVLADIPHGTEGIVTLGTDATPHRIFGAEYVEPTTGLVSTGRFTHAVLTGGVTFDDDVLTFNVPPRRTPRQYRTAMGPCFNPSHFVLYDDSDANYCAAASQLLRLPPGWEERQKRQIGWFVEIAKCMCQSMHPPGNYFRDFAHLLDAAGLNRDLLEAERAPDLGTRLIANRFLVALTRHSRIEPTPPPPVRTFFTSSFDSVKQSFRRMWQTRPVTPPVSLAPDAEHHAQARFSSGELVPHGRPPQLVVDMGIPSTPSVGQVSLLTKEVLALMKCDEDNICAHIIPTPSQELCEAFFRDVAIHSTDRVSVTFGSHGSDVSYAFTADGVTRYFNVSISRCGPSTTPVLHALDSFLAHLAGASAPDVIEYTGECTRTLKFRSVDQPRMHMSVNPAGAAGYSGHSGTTARNTIASTSIALAASRRFTEFPRLDDCETILQEVFADHGFIATIEGVSSFYKLTFARRHPIVTATGVVSSMLCISELLRSFGTCDGDLDGSKARGKTYADRRATYLRGVVSSHNGDPNHPVLKILRHQFAPPKLFGDGNVKVNNTAIRVDGILARYDISPDEFETLLGLIRNTGFNQAADHGLLTVLYEQDY